MPKISIAMIVKNEASTLGHCLASVQTLAEELIVVDTGSTDDTKEIAQSFHAKISTFAWIDDFAAARNASLAQCTGDWLLVIDADEAIDKLDHDLIRTTVQKEAFPAYRLTLRDYFTSGNQATIGVPVQLNQSIYEEGRAFSHYSDFQGLRLCKRMENLAFTGRIHELLDPFFEQQGLAISTLPAIIHHYGKVFLDREAYKKNYYMDLAKKEAQRHPELFQAHFNLVIQGMAASEWSVVLESAQACCSIKQQVPIIVALGKAIALQNLGHPDQAIPVLESILKSYPSQGVALVRMGVSQAAIGNHEKAKTFFLRAGQAQPTFSASYINLAELEQTRGNPEVARIALQHGLENCPGDPSLFEALVRLSVLQNNLPQATRDANLALRQCPGGGKGLWHRLVALELAGLGHSTHALAILEAGLKHFPNDPDLLRVQTKINENFQASS